MVHRCFNRAKSFLHQILNLTLGYVTVLLILVTRSSPAPRHTDLTLKLRLTNNLPTSNPWRERFLQSHDIMECTTQATLVLIVFRHFFSNY